MYVANMDKIFAVEQFLATELSFEKRESGTSTTLKRITKQVSADQKGMISKLCHHFPLIMS